MGPSDAGNGINDAPRIPRFDLLDLPVAEQLLHRLERHAALNHPAGERVTEAMEAEGSDPRNLQRRESRFRMSTHRGARVRIVEVVGAYLPVRDLSRDRLQDLDQLRDPEVSEPRYFPVSVSVPVRDQIETTPS
jgi:hypothetical protein